MYNKSGQAATTKTAIESLAKLLGGDVSAKASVIADMVDIEKALVKVNTLRNPNQSRAWPQIKLYLLIKFKS